MRKIALIAMLAIVGAMVPMTTAGTQPLPDTLDGVGTLMIINPGLAFQAGVWIEIEPGEWVRTAVSSPGREEIQVPIGFHNFQVCIETVAPSPDQNCGPPSGGKFPLGPGTPLGGFTIHSNDILNAAITSPGLGGPPTGIAINENDTEETETDQTKFTGINNSPTDLDVCIDGKHVIDLPGATGGPAAPLQVAEVDAKDGEEQSIQLFSVPLTGAFAACDGSGIELGPRGLPPGANTVLSLPDGLFGACAGHCIYQIFPGEEPDTGNNVDAFCAVVLEAANITPWLQDLFAEVEVGDPDTYPSPEKVEKVITRVAELLEKGNQTAPPDIRDAWFTATAAFVQTGRLATANYDLEQLPQDDLRDLVSLIDNPQADDEEELAAIDALTAWVPVNCFGAVETEPSFTG